MIGGELVFDDVDLAGAVGGGGGEMDFEGLAGLLDGGGDALGILAGLEVAGEEGDEVVPPGLPDFFVECGAADDGKFLGPGGDEDEKSVLRGGGVEVEFAEFLVGGGEGIGDAFVGDVEDDVARGTVFGGADGLMDALMFQGAEEVFDFHGMMDGLPATSGTAATEAAAAAAEAAASAKSSASPATTATTATTTTATAPAAAGVDHGAAGVHAGEDEDEEEEDDEEDGDAEPIGDLLFLVVDGGAGAGEFVTGGGEHGIDAGLDAAGVVALLEAGGDDLGDNAFADGVGEAAFESAADGDVHFAAVDEDEEDGAVVLAFLAGGPGLGDLGAILGEFLVVGQLGVDGDEDLVGGVALELVELAVEVGAGGGIKDASLVGDVLVGLGREGLGLGEEAAGEEER